MCGGDVGHAGNGAGAWVTQPSSLADVALEMLKSWVTTEAFLSMLILRINLEMFFLDAAIIIRPHKSLIKISGNSPISGKLAGGILSPPT